MDKHLTTIIHRVTCQRHAADIGEPCWLLHTIRGKRNSICGKRAKKAGFSGRISENSLRIKSRT